MRKGDKVSVRERRKIDIVNVKKGGRRKKERDKEEMEVLREKKRQKQR